MTVDHADRISARFVQALINAFDAGEPWEPIILAAHRAFARNSAELVFLGIWTDPVFRAHAADFIATARSRQMEIVEPTNAMLIGDAAAAINEQGKQAVEAAFNERLSELHQAYRSWQL